MFLTLALSDGFIMLVTTKRRRACSVTLLRIRMSHIRRSPTRRRKAAARRACTARQVVPRGTGTVQGRVAVPMASDRMKVKRHNSRMP